MQYEYCTYKYPFRAIIEDVFGKPLHLLKGDTKVVSQKTDQSSDWHKIFYNLPEDHAFFKTYQRFMRKIILPNFPEEHLFQAKPTFRVHLQGNLAVGEFHRDSDYNHSPHELNVFVPLTEAFDNNSIWLETKVGSERYLPFELCYGEYVFFDGANLKHGNHLNDTGLTRVSFDCRILPASEYRETDLSTTAAHKRFILGEYWTK